MTRIDAHQHFWRLDRGDYGWLTPDLPTIYRDFTPPILRRCCGKPVLTGP
jgi:L-fuconolactonase